MQDNDHEFKKRFFGARENITVRYQILKSKIALGLTGLFQANYGLMLGHNDLNQNDNMVLRKYVLAANVSDAEGNLHIMPDAVIPVLETFKCIEVMNFGFIVKAD